MAGINKVILIGNIGAKPELKHSATGNAITNLSIATSESWTDKNTGQKEEKTEWHRVILFSKLAEIACQYLDKGSKVYIEGKLQTRKWEDKTGVERYTTEIIVSGFNSVMQMLDNRSNNVVSNTPTQQQQPQHQQTPAENGQPQQNTITPVDNSGFDDDIPF